MNAAVYGLRFVLSYYLAQKIKPLIRGLVLTNRCNLRCRHCRVYERGNQDLSFDEVKSAIDAFYDEGGRCLYLEGGEPFLWHDGGQGIEDIVEYAHGRGFLTVVIYTNGTMPIHTSAETVFVSIDGLQETHDTLRGKSFDRILNNITDSTHPSLYVNYTINTLNKGDIQAFCEFIQGIERVRGVFFYFHTPYYGPDSLYVEPGERQRILKELLSLCRRYKVFNSRAGLISAMKNNWKRPLDFCSVYEKGHVYKCCRYSGDEELCRECGYLSYAEMVQTLKMKPSAILKALKYF